MPPSRRALNSSVLKKPPRNKKGNSGSGFDEWQFLRSISDPIAGIRHQSRNDPRQFLPRNANSCFRRVDRRRDGLDQNVNGVVTMTRKRRLIRLADSIHDRSRCRVKLRRQFVEGMPVNGVVCNFDLNGDLAHDQSFS